MTGRPREARAHLYCRLIMMSPLAFRIMTIEIMVAPLSSIGSPQATAMQSTEASRVYCCHGQMNAFGKKIIFGLFGEAGAKRGRPARPAARRPTVGRRGWKLI